MDLFLFSDPGKLVSCRPLSMILHEINFLLRINSNTIKLNTVPTKDTFSQENLKQVETLYFSGHCFENIKGYIEQGAIINNAYGEPELLDISEKIKQNCSSKLKCVYLSCCNSQILGERIGKFFPDVYIICWSTKVDDKVAYSFFKHFFQIYLEEKNRYWKKSDYITLAFEHACNQTNLQDTNNFVAIPCIIHNRNVSYHKYNPKKFFHDLVYDPKYSWMTPLQKKTLLTNPQRKTIDFEEFTKRRKIVHAECKKRIAENKISDSLEECVFNICDSQEYCVFETAQAQFDDEERDE